ncbi:MAG: sensor histidine kinase [Luteimonas sp.]
MRLLAWLQGKQLVDPVERRNAPMLQVVLLLLGTVPPMLWLARLLVTDIPWRAGETISLLTSLAISAVALWSFALIRAGRMRRAVWQLLAVVAAAMISAYAGAGLEAQIFEQPIQVMWLFVAGIMIGRRALWAMYAVLVLAMALGARTDAAASGEFGLLLGDVGIRAIMFMLIAIVIDRTVQSLRTSLDEATAQSAALAVANARLADEMVARERAQDRALHAQKVEAIGRMSSGIAHDFNHLLALMLGYLERAQDTAAPDVRNEALTALGATLQRASATTGQLLQFARDDPRRVAHFDAIEAIRNAAPLLRQALGARIPLSLSLPDAPCRIEFDPAQFPLMLLNLAANAAQAMPHGGRLGITAACRGHALRISVRDSGHGMSDDVRARAIEPFFTTRPPGQGTGLGLSAVDGMVRDAGGALALESAPGAGTAVHITLPVHVDSPSGCHAPYQVNT